MVDSFEKKPKIIQELVAKASKGDVGAREELSMRGREGAKERWRRWEESKALAEILREFETNQLRNEFVMIFENELERLKDGNAISEDGDPMSEEELEEEALKLAKVVFAMKQKQTRMSLENSYKVD